MIVGVDIREWQPGKRTGIGRFLAEFLRAVSVANCGDRFFLIGDASCEVRVRADNLDVFRIAERSTLWWDQVALPRALARARVDVFYSPYIKVPLLASVPVVSTFHDLTFFQTGEYNRRLVDLVMNGSFWPFCWLVVRRAAAILTDSRSSAADVQRFLRADPAKVRVIPLATSDSFRPDGDGRSDAEIWDGYGLSPGYVLYVGGYAPHKNVSRLVQAHAALPGSLLERHPLVLAGVPPGKVFGRSPGQPARAAALRSLGVVPDEHLPALYRGAALFAFPSLHEGFGLPVLEAMACGTPVLCSTAPALRELTGDAAAHADPGDHRAWEAALLRLLEDPGQRKALATRGLARAGQFSPERTAAGILEVLREVVGWRR